MQVTPARYTVTGGITVVQPGRTGEVHESEETQDFVAEYPSQRFPSCVSSRGTLEAGCFSARLKHL
jgi:hypothetical protein